MRGFEEEDFREVGRIIVAALGESPDLETLAARAGELCRKHPEMGPCQYERELCRNSGGRVFATGGTEITAATEAEYDKKVMRVRFRAN